MNVILACPFPSKYKKFIIRRWKERFCMNGYFDSVHPLIERPFSKAANVLDLSCTSSFGQTVHPDVLYVRKWGRGCWNYFMAVSGYPYSNDFYENPEFLVSNNGIDWALPTGGKSPVVEFPTHTDYSYNSDPALLYDKGTMWLFNREVRKVGKRSYVSISLKSSSDGIVWSESEKILSGTTLNKHPSILMSPSVLSLQGRYVVWYVEQSDNGFSIFRKESNDLRNWNKTERVVVYGTDGKEPWHIDVANDGKKLLMAMCTADENHSILLANSTDGGFIWNIFGQPMTYEKYAFGGNSLYKPALCKNENGQWLLYYSATTANGEWFTAVINIPVL